MSLIVGTPLVRIDGWSDEYVARLRDVGIDDAEQVVALSATPGGLDSLARQIGASTAEARDLVDRARDALPEHVRADMERPVDTGGYGTGALPHDPGDDSTD